MIKIIYKNKDFAVIEKPFGALSQRDASGQDGLVELLSAQLKCTVYPVHRLDRPVGGVMVYALTKQAAALLSTPDAFGKTYLAVLSGMADEFPITGELIDYLYKDSAKSKSFVVKSERKGAKQARLAYEVIKSVPTDHGKLSLIKVRLYTGRTHQIRVQFSSRGMPLVGDGKYGSRIKSESIALWSHRIELSPKIAAALRSERTSFELLPTEDGFFGLFENENK